MVCPETLLLSVFNPFRYSFTRPLMKVLDQRMHMMATNVTNRFSNHLSRLHCEYKL